MISMDGATECAEPICSLSSSLNVMFIFKATILCLEGLLSIVVRAQPLSILFVNAGLTRRNHVDSSLFISVLPWLKTHPPDATSKGQKLRTSQGGDDQNVPPRRLEGSVFKTSPETMSKAKAMLALIHGGSVIQLHGPHRIRICPFAGNLLNFLEITHSKW